MTCYLIVNRKPIRPSGSTKPSEDFTCPSRTSRQSLFSIVCSARRAFKRAPPQVAVPKAVWMMALLDDGPAAEELHHCTLLVCILAVVHLRALRWRRVSVHPRSWTGLRDLERFRRRGRRGSGAIAAKYGNRRGSDVIGHRLQGDGAWRVGNRELDPLIRDQSLLLREEPAELAEDFEVLRLHVALLAVGLQHVVVDVLERLITDEVTTVAVLGDTCVFEVV